MNHLLCCRALTITLLLVTFKALLAQSPESSTPAGADPQKIAELIERLGDSSPAARDRAQRQLEVIGPPAFDSLMDAQSHSDLEVSLRAKYLVATIDIPWTRSEDSSAVQQLLAKYRASDDASRLTSMKLLAALPDGEGLPALVRLVRYEKSALVSKLGALMIISPEYPAEQHTKERTTVIQAALGPSQRPTANWLRLFLSGQASPGANARAWNEIVESEMALLDATSEDTSQSVIAGLLHLQISVLQQANQEESAGTALRKLFELEKDDPLQLVQSIDRFIRRKDWSSIESLANFAAVQIEKSADLLYAFAHAHREQGRQDVAEELVKKAISIAAGDPREHLRVAYGLERRGIADWCEQEYRHVIDMQGIDPGFPMIARFQLSELQHDRQRELEAAETIKPVADSITSDTAIRDKIQMLDRLPEAVQSRLHYFYALHYKGSGDRAKQVEHLEKAIGYDRTDADVLIAMYELPDQTDEQRAATLARIQEAATIFRESTVIEPDDSTAYNQYAWLIGNTEGDFEEAIRFSHKSLELRPGTAGYLDTLAHCYFAKGDQENAVRYQGQAVALEPHSQQIRRAFVRFQGGAKE